MRRAVLEVGFPGRTCSTRRPVFWNGRGPPLRFSCAGIRARFGTQIPGAFWSPDSGLLFVLLTEAGIWTSFRARNLGSKMRPDSSKNHGHVVRQWCSSGATRPPAEESILCPIKDGTSVCQFHDGCNLQPVRPAVVAAGLLKMSELKCAKKCLNKEAILATPGNGTLSPKTVPRFRASNRDLVLEPAFLFLDSDSSGN